MSDEDTENRWQKGLEAVDQVYGTGSAAMMSSMSGLPAVAETVNHLFGEIWTRPGLSIRDRRLMVIGATTMLGRVDLLTIQLAGGIFNGEFSDEQLDEMPLQMMFYAGAGNMGSLQQAIYSAKARAEELKDGA